MPFQSQRNRLYNTSKGLYGKHAVYTVLGIQSYDDVIIYTISTFIALRDNNTATVKGEVA